MARLGPGTTDMNTDDIAEIIRAHTKPITVEPNNSVIDQLEPYDFSVALADYFENVSWDNEGIYKTYPWFDRDKFLRMAAGA